MVSRPMSKGVAVKALKSSKGVVVGEASTTRKKVSKLIACCDGGEWPVRDRTSGVFGMKSVGSGGRLVESEQETDPLGVSCSTNKGEVLGKSPAHFIIRWNEGSCQTNK